MTEIGQKGKSYGLIIKSQPQTQKPKLQVPSIFATDDDDNEPKTVNQVLQEDSARRKQAKKTDSLFTKALAEDPTAFDYDGIYDSMKTATFQQEVEKRAAKLNDRKPKYVAQIMETQKKRKREQDIIYNKNLLKEKDKEGNEFVDKDKYITAAYKKRLEEDKVWEEEEARRAANEDDVTKKTDLRSFYSSYLNQVAASKEATIKSTQKKDVQSEDQSKQKPKENQKPVEMDTQNSDTKKHNMESNLKENRKEQEKTDVKAPKVEKPETGPSKEEIRISVSKQIEKENEEKEKKLQAEKEEAAKKLARKNDEAAVADARARYLQRKAAASKG